jgi:hypothetical protein
VDATLVGAALVLDHGGLAAEAVCSVSDETRSPSREGGDVPLQAAIMRALIWALAGVDSAVAGKTRGLMGSVWNLGGGEVGCGQAHIGESLPTANMLALMRLLACVCTDVDGQGAPLDEALHASGRQARIWALVCVDAVMSLEIRLAVEALPMLSACGNRKQKRRGWRTYLGAGVPIALEGASRRLILNELHEFHFDMRRLVLVMGGRGETEGRARGGKMDMPGTFSVLSSNVLRSLRLLVSNWPGPRGLQE